jgi:mycoredoxin
MDNESQSKIIVYGTTWCPDTIRARNFLDSKGIVYLWVDIDKDGEGRKVVEKVNNGKRSVPTIIFSDGSTLVEPSNSQLASKLKL